MREYLQLRHMNEGEIFINSTYYMPHHAVLKESSTMTKLRVVFDVSAKTTSGLSLNDLLMVGPKVQQELFPILLRFRTYKIAVCADVDMFRQIRVHPEDTNWQRIPWRDSPRAPLSAFRLVTVTYGTACAPYLSTKVMKQLALDEQARFLWHQKLPFVTFMLMNCF
ncbi:uncharacterized protein LOC118192667 [Stegodyphus dumicola]|uniref:uncharacterized protein LOC118192667 n=1 Tax=Stegodyphus dumicola TaxID=202533 RepID=UPI0015AD22D2|nr:uncharacterized protein LOC118192667 [Stegodyphus dumicola]